MVLAAIGVSACDLLPTQPPNGGLHSDVPHVVANRIPLPSCGEEQAGQGGPWNEGARACFWEAYQEHRPAEFISTYPTIEGDPITSIYRVLPDGSVEIFIDSTRDRFGSGSWLHVSCRTLARRDGTGARNDFGPDDTCVAVPLG